MLPGALGANATHESQTPHGVAVGPWAQFNDRARMRADDVFPQPRGPENRYAWLIRPADKAMDNGSVTCSCPTTSAKVAGRYLRYRATSAGYRRPVTIVGLGVEPEITASSLRVCRDSSPISRPQRRLGADEASKDSEAASSAQVASPSTALRRSGTGGKVGAIRMFLSSGSFRYGNDAPASVTAIPASLARATVRRAVPGNTSRLMKYPPFGLVQEAILESLSR